MRPMNLRRNAWNCIEVEKKLRFMAVSSDNNSLIVIIVY